MDWLNNELKGDYFTSLIYNIHYTIVMGKIVILSSFIMCMKPCITHFLGINHVVKNKFSSCQQTMTFVTS